MWCNNKALIRGEYMDYCGKDCKDFYKKFEMDFTKQLEKEKLFPKKESAKRAKICYTT